MSCSVPPHPRLAPGRRPVLGLLLDWLEDDYQTAVLCGVSDSAKQQDASVLCFAGGELGSPDAVAAQRNRVFELASSGNIDALIVVAGSIGNHVGSNGIVEFLRRFGQIPTCSIAVPLAHVPSILVDNARGMRDAIEHLIVHHGFQRIAFIRGPEVNQEAERRFRVYRETLAMHSIAFDDRLVAIGDFHRPSGMAAIERLLGLGRRRIDAVVAASDYMALGAIDALTAAGYRVPTDIAVVGFDDIDEARFASPPLTTVRQPLYEQGLQAANIACAMLRGIHVEGHVTLHTELVTRSSCGCFSQVSARSQSPLITAREMSWEDAISERRERILADMSQSLRGRTRVLAIDWQVRLLDELVADLSGRQNPGFLLALEQLLSQVIEKGSDGSVCQDVISVLRRELLGCFNEPLIKAKAEELWQQARQLIGSAVERAQAQQRLEAERWVRVLSETNERVITTFDVVSLASAVAEQLPRLGIQSCYLSLYERNDEHLARLILAHDRRRNLGDHWIGKVFRTSELLPEGLTLSDQCCTYIVEPLYFKEHPLGFALFEMGPRQGIIYEALRDQVSAALKGALLVQQVVEKDQERERLMQALGRRAEELEMAYQALKKNQEMLLSVEKMAGIGRLTASIAHEMNTPVAAIRAALAELDNRVGEYAASVSDSEVTVEDHREIIAEMRQALTLAKSAAGRAADFVGSIKNQTRDTGKKERIVFDCVAILRESLLLLGHLLRKGNCRVQLRPSAEVVEIRGTPGRFAQVVTNLVSNSIDAMLPKGGTIDIELVADPEKVRLSVADAGPGVAPELHTQIFEPLFTTKPFGQGTGLGLTIVREIVTGELGGTIEVRNREEGGALFQVTFARDLGKNLGLPDASGMAEKLGEFP